MKHIDLTYLLFMFSLLFAACSSDNIAEDKPMSILPSDEAWVEKDIEGSSVTVKPFLPGDAVSRSSFVFDGQQLVFGWKDGDIVGIYPTAMTPQTEDEERSCLDPTQYPHPNSSVGVKRIDPEKSSQMPFRCDNPDGSQTAKITNDSNPNYFLEESKTCWTAYFPYVDAQNETYAAKTFSFANQTQNGIPDMLAYYHGDNEHAPGATNPLYVASEARACEHLGGKDVMISPEVVWDSYKIRFHMRHVGAVIRLFLLAPEEKLVLTNIKLICDTPIFYTSGTYNLKSHPNNDSEENKGLNLELDDDDCQISPIISSESGPSKKIELNFEGETAKTDVESTKKKRYIIAYMMTYPITYDPSMHGNLFAYVTAYKQGDESRKEYHFVSEPLAGKIMESGKLYQWTSSTHPDDGLYPIELTATLLPWQDIVGAGIETDLEK